MRTPTIFGVAVLAGALALAACGKSNSNQPTGSGVVKPPKIDKMASLGTGEGTVNLVAWAGYVENGSNDKTVDWVTPFEKSTGCKVQREDRRHVRRDGHAHEIR
jgi:putative spermidine/putrescine transport system substrate-binding protein